MDSGHDMTYQAGKQKLKWLTNLFLFVIFDHVVMLLSCEGHLWIHAASKIPEPDTIKAMEDFYREIYAVNGITDIKFPEHYPVSRLLGFKSFSSIINYIIYGDFYL